MADLQSITAVELCLHDLQLYANDHWLDHVQALASQEEGTLTQEEDLLPLRNGLERLTSTHNQLAPLYKISVVDADSMVARSEDSCWDPLFLSPNARALLTQTLIDRKAVSAKDTQNSNSTSAFLTSSTSSHASTLLAYCVYVSECNQNPKFRHTVYHYSRSIHEYS